MSTQSPETRGEKKFTTKKNCAPSWLYLQDYCKGTNNLVMKITMEENVQFRTLHDIRIPFSQEVCAVIRKLKNNRPPGEDSIKV
jgi:hypothetical protein